MTKKTTLTDLADAIEMTSRDMREVASDLLLISDLVKTLNAEIDCKRRNNLREDSIDILLQREGLPW